MKASKRFLKSSLDHLRLQTIHRFEVQKNRSLRRTDHRNPSTASQSQFWMDKLQRLTTGFLQFWVGDRELQVWQTTDRSGQLYWNAFDPITEETVIRNSEAEMRVWIEKHYHEYGDRMQQRYENQLLFQR